MELNIISNGKKDNHLSQMQKFAKKSDTLIIVSPFLAEDISKLVAEMPSIKKLTLYTTLQKYEDTAQKVIALYEFHEFCKNQNIDLMIKIDDNLHGKVYLFYKGIDAQGFVLTSGNFTENGLKNNHEYGVYIKDDEKQKEMADILMSANTYDLTHMQLCEIYDVALKFIKKHPVVQQEKFKVHTMINKRPSVTQNSTLKYYLKPVGTSKNPFVKPEVIKEKDKLGFGSNPRTMQKGDVLLLHSVGPSSIVGYYVVTSDEAVYDKIDNDDRWPWKVSAECHSSKFSAFWWDYELKTQELMEEFLTLYPGCHITAAGGDTLGALQWGRDKVEITKDFAQFVISRIPG